MIGADHSGRELRRAARDDDHARDTFDANHRRRGALCCHSLIFPVRFAQKPDPAVMNTRRDRSVKRTNSLNPFPEIAGAGGANALGFISKRRGR
jgi:hypothetical protein